MSTSLRDRQECLSYGKSILMARHSVPYIMSELRKQLDDAKVDYQSANYPGDLAADVFARQATRSPSFWRKAAPYIAAAACVAVVVGWTLLHQPRHGDVAIAPPTTQGRTQHTSGSDGHVAHIFDSAPEPETFDGASIASSELAPEAIPESPTTPSDLPLVPSMTSESIPSPPSLASMDFSSDQSSF